MVSLEGSVELGVLAQHYRAGFQDQVVHADPVLSRQRVVKVPAQAHGLSHIHFGRDVEMGRLPFAIHGYPGNGLPHAREVYPLSGQCRPIGRGGGRNRGGRGRGKLQHILFHYSAAGAGAGNQRQVYALLLGQTAGDRGYPKPVAVPLRGGGSRLGGGYCPSLWRRRDRLRAWRLSLGPGGRVFRHLIYYLIRTGDNGDKLSNGNGNPLIGNYSPQDPGGVGLELHRRLVGLNVGYDLSPGHFLSFALVPLDDSALTHVVAHLGHNDVCRQGLLLITAELVIQSAWRTYWVRRATHSRKTPSLLAYVV